MKKFAGFPDRMRYTPVPNVFFSSLMAEIDDLGELKVTLHLFRALFEQRGFPRFVRLSQLVADRPLLMALREPAGRPPEQRLVAGLDRACERGSLLEVRLQVGLDEGNVPEGTLPSSKGEDRCYLLNTTLNRDLVNRVERGELSLGEGAIPRAGWVALPEQRPGIYDLYEQNIGLITPLIAEELHEAEAAYPAEWIEEAFREAVSYNRRNWRYVRRILENWAINGRGEDGKGRRSPKGSGSPSRYLEGKYAHILKR